MSLSDSNSLVTDESTIVKILLPPAYVVRREGNVFAGVSLSVHTGGVGGGTPVPGSFPGLWSQVFSREGSLVLAREVCSPGLGGGG